MRLFRYPYATFTEGEKEEGSGGERAVFSRSKRKRNACSPVSNKRTEGKEKVAESLSPRIQGVSL